MPPDSNTGIEMSATPFMVRAPVPSVLRGSVRRITGYRENGAALDNALEAASLVVPLVISFGSPFAISLSGAPAVGGNFGSFTSGLHPGYVLISSSGHAECIQIDLTPQGARCLFGIAMSEISARVVTLDDLGDAGVDELRSRLVEEEDWNIRFGLVTAFLKRRLAMMPTSDTPVGWSCNLIEASHGAVRIGEVAAELGWSRKHLNARFREEVGVGPKSFARMARFNHALAVASRKSGNGWAALAADCGYADQAHLVREFREFAGMTPPMAMASFSASR